MMTVCSCLLEFTLVAFWITPVGNTPVGITHVVKTHVGITPVGITPVGITPVGITPVAITPVGITPVRITPSLITVGLVFTWTSRLSPAAVSLLISHFVYSTSCIWVPSLNCDLIVASLILNIFESENFGQDHP